MPIAPHDRGHRQGRRIRLVAYPPVAQAWVQGIRACAPDMDFVNARSEQEALAAISEATAFVGRITPALLTRAHNLVWIQATSVGMEHTIFPALAQSNVVLTNVRGVFSDVLADHVMAFVLSFARGLHIYARQQVERLWKREADALYLPGKTMGIIGLGGIGMAVALRAKAFGLRIVAVDPRRAERPDSVEQLWTPRDLDRLLESADLVVISAPHTPETEGMIGLAQLERMKPSAYLINVGRGAIVDLEALTQGLREGLIAGAGLDVFEIEPLPEDHPLWGMENVIITPHTAGAKGPIEERRRKVFLDNLHRFIAGETLCNIVDKKAWY